jgi:putative hydrolase of the HAD superfamily
MGRKIRAVLFDAGNTLIFPQLEEIARDLTGLGYPASVDDFYVADRIGKRKLDEWLWPQIERGEAPRKADYFYWTEYLRAVIERVGVPEDQQQEIGSQLAAGFSRPTVWSRMFPETAWCLEDLRRKGFVLGVISNSLGFIEEQLRHANLADYFSFIIDSHLVGVEKPHPEIFRMAVERCGCSASEAVFVGDLYSTDIGGARAAGLHGVLLDWIQAYPEAPAPRIRSLLELEVALVAVQAENY